MGKDKPLFSELYGICPESIKLERYFRLPKPLSDDEHRAIIFKNLHECNGSLYPRMGGELILEDDNVKILQDYKAYILKPDWAGIIIGTINLENEQGKFQRQTVYTHSFNVWTDNTHPLLKQLAIDYSAKGAEIWPRVNFTYGEIKALASDDCGSAQRFSEGMDVALDIDMLRKAGLEERIADGKVFIVQTFGIPKDLQPSLDMFCKMVLKEEELLKSPFPKFIQQGSIELEP